MKLRYHLLAGASTSVLCSFGFGQNDGQSAGWLVQTSLGAVCFVSHLLPDIDYITKRGGGQAFLKHHRGVTHSLVFALTVPWLFALPMYFIQHGWHWVLFGGYSGMIGCGTHLLLDVLNPYPMALLWPIKKRVSLNLIYFRDPGLGLCLALGGVFYGTPIAALIVLVVFLVLLLSLRIGFLIYAKKRFPFFKKHLGREKLEKVEFVPDPMMPWQWKVAIKTDDAWHAWNLDILAGRAVDRYRIDRRETGLVRRARAQELIRQLDAYTDFFAMSEKTAKDGGFTEVVGKDMRFHFFGTENPFRVVLKYEGNKLVSGTML